MRTRRLIIAPEPGLVNSLRTQCEKAAAEKDRAEDRYGELSEIVANYDAVLVRLTRRLRRAEHSHHLGAKLFAL